MCLGFVAFMFPGLLGDQPSHTAAPCVGVQEVTSCAYGDWAILRLPARCQPGSCSREESPDRVPEGTHVHPACQWQNTFSSLSWQMAHTPLRQSLGPSFKPPAFPNLPNSLQQAKFWQHLLPQPQPCHLPTPAPIQAASRTPRTPSSLLGLPFPGSLLPVYSTAAISLK